jgi:hypothetical protein
MPRNDDIEEAGPDLRAPHAAQGAPHRLGTVPRAALLTPPEAPADLRAALATIPAEWGRRMFDPASLDTRMAACKLTVKHPEDLLVLRQALFDDLCPSITWILRTSVLEWEHLFSKSCVSPSSASPSYALRPCACRTQGLPLQLNSDGKIGSPVRDSIPGVVPRRCTPGFCADYSGNGEVPLRSESQ